MVALVKLDGVDGSVVFRKNAQIFQSVDKFASLELELRFECDIGAVGAVEVFVALLNVADIGTLVELLCACKLCAGNEMFTVKLFDFAESPCRFVAFAL